MTTHNVSGAKGEGRPVREPAGREGPIPLEKLAAVARSGTPALHLYRIALNAAVSELEASFGSIFLRDSLNPSLLQLACARNWPQASARFMARMRIRLGRGATGLAVSENRIVETEDVFADLSLQEWWEPARELGFTAAAALPLRADGRTEGALTLYFAKPRKLQESERLFLDQLGDQLSAALE